MIFVCVVCCYLMRAVLSVTSLACSEYLVSGLSGVADDAFTASGWYGSDGTDDYSPDNARLYYDKQREDIIGGSAWCSDTFDFNTYIQVSFETETVIDSVIIQGREDYNQYVMTFYILYSMDGTTWSTVTAANGDPKTFVGNTDNNSTVKIGVLPTITAMHVRINARSWYEHPCVRFDLGGCRNISPQRAYYDMASLSSTAVLGQTSVLDPAAMSLPACAVACHSDENCYSFTFDGQTCHGYTLIGKTSYSSGEVPYYYNTAIKDIQAYQHDPSVNLLYKVNELHRTNMDASDMCTSFGSQLVKVDTIMRMNALQDVIGQNNVLNKDFRFHVSGQYVYQWQYGDGQQISDVTLWSPTQPDLNQGVCVMLTQTGLASVDCAEILFSICEY